MFERVDILIEEYGLKLGRRSDRLTIRRGEELIFERPLRQVRSISMRARGTSLSSDLIAACAEHHIPIGVCAFGGEPLARLVSPTTDGEAATRRAQITLSPQRSFSLAKLLLAEKCRGALRLCRYIERRVKPHHKEDFALELERQITQGKRLVATTCAQDEALDDALARLMGHEGASARAYWAAWGATLSPQPWHGRHKRGAHDPVNMSLNYGYAILRDRIWGMVERAHLDPYAGALHRDRPGRPGLVLDLMEPWRVLVEDAVCSLARRAGKPWAREGAPVEQLTSAHRRAVAAEVLQRLDAPARFGPRHARVAACMQQSVREVARYIRGEVDEPKMYRWDVRGPKRANRDADDDPLERLFCRTRARQ